MLGGTVIHTYSTTVANRQPLYDRVKSKISGLSSFQGLATRLATLACGRASSKILFGRDRPGVMTSFGSDWLKCRKGVHGIRVHTGISRSVCFFAIHRTPQDTSMFQALLHSHLNIYRDVDIVTKDAQKHSHRDRSGQSRAEQNV